ncbi:MAG: SusC/RagA family TonB-linked outer membrane protein, partial [Cyclobacteriaceae bacterium]|nr:SusC/RagA family TonB-linked outer membrane protein [Cyclobacteriaceae bacterium]
MKHSFTYLLLLLLSISFVARGQSRSVTGSVKDPEGGTLPGVTVQLKGTSTGTITDVNGEYSIEYSDEESVLVFSYVGYKTQEVAISNRSIINVSLEVDIQQLSEVVVTALGISQEKRKLGYSIQTVSGNSIAETQRPNFMVSLQGRVAGLSMISTSGLPGSSTSINLRGINSITGNNQPLIVVDGLPIENRVFNTHNLVSNGDNRNNDYINRAADINPNDIESVSILKGPEAAALYGQDGSSGAIIITTKKGKDGPARIIYDNNFGFQKVNRYPQTQTVYGRGNFGYDNPDLEELTFFGPKYGEGVTIYDNVESFFRTGTNQNHNLTIEGGNKTTTNRVSLNYYNTSGIVPNNTYDKLSARVTSTTKVFEKLDVTSSLNYVSSANKKPLRGSSGYLLSVLSWPSDMDITDYLNPDGSRKKYTDDVNEPDNPFYSVYKNNNSSKTDRVMANLSASFDALSWLNISGRLGGDIYSSRGNLYVHEQGYSGIGVKGSIEEYNENSKLLNGQLLTTVKKKINKIDISFLLGSAFDDKNYLVTALYGEDLQLKEFNTLNNTRLDSRKFVTGLTRKRSVSAFSNLNIGYNDLIYLTITGRNDWSSTLPLKNRSYFYPSFSSSFVFSELSFLQNQNVMTFGKIRASYAEVGKDVSAYKVRSSLASRSTTGGGFSYDYYGGNEDLQPERAKGYELGAEMKFLNSRIGLDLALFANDRINQVSQQRLSYGTGFIFGLLNGGSISVRGLEVQLSATPFVRNDMEWEVLLNFSKSKSKVLELPAKVKEFYNSDTWLYGGARGSAFPENFDTFFNPDNYPYYNWDYHQDGMGSATAIGGTSYERNANGDILINPASGYPIKTGDYLPIGDRNPDFMIGLTNSFKYKNFNVTFLLDIRKGGDVYNGNELYLYRKGLSTLNLDRETPVTFTGVLKDGNENSANPTMNTIEIIPYSEGSIFYGAAAESDFIEKDINWIRLRDLTLAYNLPLDILAN